MCRPSSEGGQRCAAHTRKDLQRALRRHAAQPTPDTEYQVQSTLAEYAATPAGAAELMRRVDDLPADSGEAYELRQALRRGGQIRERNAALAALTVNLGSADQRARRAIDPRTPPAILERLARDKMAHIRLLALHHPRATTNMLTAAAVADDVAARTAVAEHPQAGILLDQLSRDPHPMVRAAVAGNGGMPRNYLAIMWQQETDPNVQAVLAERLGLLPAVAA